MATRGRSLHTPRTIITPDHDDDNDNQKEKGAFGHGDPLLSPMLVASKDNGAEEDPFYSLDMNQDQNILRVFPIDYDRLVQRLKHAKWFAAAASALLLGVGIWLYFHSGSSPLLYEEDDRFLPFAMSALFAAVFVGMWWTEGKNEQRIRGQHVAVTRAGIRRDMVDEHGVQTTTTIPWEYLRRVDRCSRDLVRIHHRSTGGKPVELEGLYDVYDFVELVNTVKDKTEAGESIV
eukprot:scaffold5535_cov180-Amphora_coffeaeformis.AAC.6